MDIKETLKDIKTTFENGIYDKHYESERVYHTTVNTYELAHIVEKLCDVMIELVECQEKQRNDTTNTIQLCTPNYPTWEEYIADKYMDDIKRRKILDFTCHTGIKCILCNVNTHQTMITKFDPKNITIDWHVVYSEGLHGAEHGIIIHILRGLGWFDGPNYNNPV